MSTRYSDSAFDRDVPPWVRLVAFWRARGRGRYSPIAATSDRVLRSAKYPGAVLVHIDGGNRRIALLLARRSTPASGVATRTNLSPRSVATHTGIHTASHSDLATCDVVVRAPFYIEGAHTHTERSEQMVGSGCTKLTIQIAVKRVNGLAYWSTTHCLEVLQPVFEYYTAPDRVDVLTTVYFVHAMVHKRR